MATTPVNPSLFFMLGRGYLDDHYAIDGNHLRWAFAPRLGFTRFAFCVEFRDSVAGDQPPRELIRDLDLRLPPGSPPQTLNELALPELAAHRPGAQLARSVAGIALAGDPLVLRLRGQDAHACWLRLRLVARAGGLGAASAAYLDRGDPQVIDRAEAAAVQPRVLAPGLTGARIDQVSLTGAQADLERLSWIRTEDLMADGGWRPLACFPAATAEPDYFARNKELFDGADPAEVAKDRIAVHGPVGVEPLDDPVVPPPRPATDVEKQRRYLEPWLKRLEPWLAQVLSASLGGALHQSEVTITEELDDAGQRRGHGIPGGLAGFPTARLLGLGCVDTKPSADPLDYRVRGRWLVEDLWAWVGATERRLK